ncbi:MAG TPA: Rieske (2Fe-2S) protein [Actinomycetales bacterium]|nr:Rieske (2Fe-2S) protein [Actinomycetales bacterium]
MDAEDLCPSRRTMLRSLATLGGVVLVPGVLVACSSDPPAPADPSEASGDDGAEDGSEDGSEDDGSEDDGSEGQPSAAGATVPASEVAVGQARVVDAGGQRVVVAQPTEGEFVAFSATCTHEGTTVGADDGLTLTCPNHGSRFDATDGSVINGPAARALPAVDVTLEGDQLVFS